MPHPALDQLTPALNAVRAASQARAWQVNWVLGELTAALDNGDLPLEARNSARVLLTTFLEHADAGMPLSTRTLRDQYQAVVDWLNEARSDDPGWTPIPASLERLRLSGTPVVAHPDTARPVR